MSILTVVKMAAGLRIIGEGDDLHIIVCNEGGYNSTCISVCDVIEWVRANRPDLIG